MRKEEQIVAHSYEIAQLALESVNELITQRECPHCRRICSFITVHTLIEDPHKGYDSRDYVRCLMCLRLYREQLTEVVEHDNER
jgi:hypothetical protein